MRGGARDWPAVSQWNSSLLHREMGEEKVTVACSPNGRADGLVSVRPDGYEWRDEVDGGGSAQGEREELLVMPLEREMEFGHALESVITQERLWGVGRSRSGNEQNTEVRYLQSRKSTSHSPLTLILTCPENDNLRTTYAALMAYVPATISWAAEGLALSSGADTTSPDAVNIWLGNSLSTTSLHRDPYENIYVQVRGRKHFVLVSPVAVAAVGEKMRGLGRWVCKGENHGDGPDHDSGARWRVEREGGDEVKVPVAGWDPGFEDGADLAPVDAADIHVDKCRRLITPLKVTLEEGDMLYLPALWYVEHPSRPSLSPAMPC